MRDIDKENFGNKNRTWNDDALYNGLLTTWETDTNAALERIGAESRVDRRSFEDQGVDQLAGVHRGIAVEQMQQQGKPTRVGELEAERKFDQAIYPYVKEIEEKGELQYKAADMEPLSWRERLSDVAIRAREAAVRVYEQVSDRVRGWFQRQEDERREETRRRDRTLEPNR